MTSTPENPDLSLVLERACQFLGGIDGPRLWETSRRITVHVPTEGGSLVAFKLVYADEKALSEALERRDGPLRSAAIALVAECDRTVAARLLGDLLQTADLSSAHPSSFEGSVARTAGYVFPVLVDHIAPLVLRDLWLLGRVRMNVVSDEAVASTPIANIARACRETRSLDLDADRLTTLHAELGAGEGALELLGALHGSSQYHLILQLIRAIESRKDIAAVPVLMSYATGADTRYHALAAKALLAIGTREAHEALASLLDAPEERAGTLHAAAEAAIRLDPPTSFARLGARLAESALGTPGGLGVARAILGAPAHLLRQDPGWLDLLAQSLGDPRLGTRGVLSSYPVADIEAALKRAGSATPAARKVVPLPSPPRWLERYLAGEHEAVWREIVRLEGSIRDASVLPEAEAVARRDRAR